MRRFFSLCVMFLALAVISPICSGAQSAPAKRPPNIIVILCDDLGWSELGCYGNRFNETPQIDRLARGGMRFTDAYAAAPVCSPTRAALMTGQYPARVGITDFLRGDDERFLSPEYDTPAEVLQRAGYATGLIGKWHLMGDYAKRKGRPAIHGFEEVICSETKYIADGSYFAPYWIMPEVQAPRREYLTDRLNREAVDFIRRHREKPFFLYLSHYAVHTRLAAKKPMIERFAAKLGPGADKKPNATLAAMLLSIDEGVGRISETLGELGLAEDTLVIFTSDNGGELRVTSNAPLRGGKSMLYEGGIRVPLIVSWPGQVRPGTTCGVPVITPDLYATIAALAGAAPGSRQISDGVSLVPLIKGAGKVDRDALYWHYPLAKAHFLGGKSVGALRRGDDKLIEFLDTGDVELYDLRTDPGETHNLAIEQPAKAARLREQLVGWRESVGARPIAAAQGSAPGG